MTAPEIQIGTDRKFRFGIFEVDFAESNLWKRGMRVKIQQKPLHILQLLIERHGELVTRAELARHLWPGLHVNFDRSLNTAVNMLRQALGDSSQNPRFIETRSGLGYRFIAPVEIMRANASARAESSNTANSIVVLPFENNTADPALHALADGLAEHVIIALSNSDGIRVIARSAAFRFREPGLDVQEVGRRLNVCAAVTGRLAMRGSAIVITCELVDIESGSRLWGHEYEQAVSEIGTLARAIAEEISRMLLPSLRRTGKPVVTSTPANFEAYQDYLKGRFFHHKLRDEDLRKSVAHFEAALARDPRYALAYTGLADTYNLSAFLGIVPAHEAQQHAREYAMAALRIDPDLAEGHVSLGAVKKLYDWDWAGAEAEYLTALRLNPNYAPGRQSFATFLAAMGRFDEALQQVRKALELDPLALVIQVELAWILYMSRDYRASMEQSWQTLTMEPRFAAAQQTLGLAYVQMGLFEEAVIEFQNARVCSEDHPASMAALCHACAVNGQRSEAEAIAGQLERLSCERHVSPYWLGLAYTGLGDNGLALEYLWKAFELRDVWMLWLKTEPRFDRLRSDPGFGQLLRKMNLSVQL